MSSAALGIVAGQLLLFVVIVRALGLTEELREVEREVLEALARRLRGAREVILRLFARRSLEATARGRP